MEWIITIVICLLLGGVSGWVIKPPVKEKEVTEIRTEIRIDVTSKSVANSYQIVRTDIYQVNGEIFSLSLTNTNYVTNLIRSIITNTNYYISTTNKEIKKMP